MWEKHFPTGQCFMIVNPEIGLNMRKIPNKTFRVPRLGLAEGTGNKESESYFPEPEVGTVLSVYFLNLFPSHEAKPHDSP